MATRRGSSPVSEITPHVTAIDWTGRTPAPDLDSATTASRDALYRAIDARLAAMPSDVPTTTPQPDHATTQVVGAGLAVAAATDDHLAADTILRLCEHTVSLREQVHTTRTITSASLAHLHRHHRRIAADREARHVG